ncbi:MAG: TolB family protein [Polyangiales bacterium]
MRFEVLMLLSLCSATACSGNSSGGGDRSSGGQAGGSSTPATNTSNPSGAIAGGATTQLKPTGASQPQMMATTPTTGASSGSRMPVSIDQTGSDNPAGLNAADVTALIAGGPPGSLKFLYPYDGTVFPRGLEAPLLMWDGGTPDAVYVHIKSQLFEYKGVLKSATDMTTGAPQLALPQDVWVKAGQQTNGKSDPFTLELTARISGAVAGPIALHFVIAQATVKGSIYYNSYASKLPGAAVGGNVLRIPAGGQVELFNSMECNGCHVISADGSRMLSQIELVSGGDSYQLMAGGTANPPGVMAGQRVSFGALYPDGSKYISTSTASPVGHADIAQAPGTSADSALYDSNTGQVVPNSGVPTGAIMPNISPDGTRLAFNDFAIDSAHGLAVMDYDVHTDKASNYQMLTHDSGTLRPGWPFFLPDDKALVFVRTDSADFTGNGAFVGAGGLAQIAGPFASVASLPIVGPNSDLHIVDIATGTVTVLAKAMGYNTPDDAANDKPYLTFPDELHQTYFPTIAPIAAGGYFWLFFDSIRHYGNLGLQRQLWGAAIDIAADGSYAYDPSHPAFYLPGQEFGAGNHRAFAALDPCKKDGDSCTSGIDCCGGTCNFPEGTGEFATDAVGTCSPPKMNACAKRDERCTSTADCCPPEAGQPPNTCIAGFCAFISVQ